MSSTKQLQDILDKITKLEGEVEALALQADEQQAEIEVLIESKNRTIRDVEEKKKEIESLSSIVALVHAIKDELQESFNTLCIAQTTGGATDADFQTFAQAVGIEVQTESTPEEEGEEEAA